jgi:sortase A
MAAVRRRAPRQLHGEVRWRTWWDEDTVRLPAVTTGPSTGARRPGGVGRAWKRARFRTVLRGVGEAFITCGLVVLLLLAYELWGKVAVVNAHQHDMDRRLSQAWSEPTVAPSASPSAPAPPPPEGAAIGRLHIPRLGLQWVVVEGVALRDIRYGPGHYVGTAMPGGIGNFAVAGHRSPGIFWDLDKVRAGDYLIVETAADWYVYQVFQNHIVTPRSFEVVAPTPNQAGVPPTEADITLTTCNPKWNNYQRMAVHGRLVQTSPHELRPPELSGV